MAPRKVVITGMGLVTAVGLDTESNWKALVSGTNGVGPIEGMDLEGFKTTFAAQIKNFDPTLCMDPKEARKSDRFVQLAMAAAVEAMDQADVGEVADPFRAGVIIGSGIGGMLTFEDQHRRFVKRGARAVSPLFIPMMISDMASGLVSIRYGFRIAAGQFVD